MGETSQAQLVWKVLEEAVRADPDRRGLVYKGRDISFREIDEASDRVACGLLKLGFKKGDRIAINALNQPEWLYTYYAAAKIGTIVVGLNVRYRDTELEYILNQSQTRAVVSLTDLLGMDYVKFFDEFRPQIPSVKEFIFLGETEFEGSQTFESLLNTDVDLHALDQAKAEVRPDDPLILIYTSGTTGKPKGAVITNKSQTASGRAQIEHMQATADDLLLTVNPFNHVGGITCAILSSLIAKMACVIIPAFDLNDIITQWKKYQPTVFGGVPTMFALMLMNEEFRALDKSAIRIVVTGGSNCDPPLLKAMKDAFPNAFIMNLYGLSESSGAVVLSPWESDFDTTVRSIGKPIGDFVVKVIDIHGQTLPMGETGELLFKGDAIGGGYFRMPEETSETFDSEGWLHTGDMGYLDEEGYIHLMGRKKEMYLQGGYNVYPVEVENVLAKHPDVLMAAGIGVPDPVLGEVGRYYVMPRSGSEPTEEELKTYCKEHLADYKTPKQIVFRSELPLTPLGKIMKSVLMEEYKKTGQ